MNPFSKLKLPSSLRTPPPSSTQTPQPPGVRAAGQASYLPGRPGIGRALWAAHPNRTTRKLRKLLVSWEELGFFLSYSGTPPQVSPATENSFLKVKVKVAKSISFLKSIHGMGDIGREASAKERDFIEILERYPSLYAALEAADEDKKELFAAWHSLYLFLHKVLGAAPREVFGESVLVPLRLQGESQGAARNVRPFRAGKTA